MFSESIVTILDTIHFFLKTKHVLGSPGLYWPQFSITGSNGSIFCGFINSNSKKHGTCTVIVATKNVLNGKRPSGDVVLGIIYIL